MSKQPNLSYEKKLWKEGIEFVIGIDEVGRGCLAGPVTAGAVCLLPFCQYNDLQIKERKIRDSKKLSPLAREGIFKTFRNSSFLRWSTASVSHTIIDKKNIVEATKLAMEEAIRKLLKKIYFDEREREVLFKRTFLLIDGKIELFDGRIPQKSIVRGDEKILSIALASIMAKVKRDRIMKRYHQKYPQYNFAQHKGYPTFLHFLSLKKFGSSPIHRLSFLSPKSV